MTQADQLAESSPRSSRRKWLLLGFLILLPIGIVGGTLCYFLYQGRGQLRDALAETDALDPNWRMADIEAHRATVPETEDAVFKAREAKRSMPQGWPAWDMPPKGPESAAEANLREALSSGFQDLQPPVQLNADQIKALRAELKRAEPALVVARQLAHLPHGRYPIAWTKDYISTLLPHVQDVRECAMVLSYDTKLRLQDQDLAGALQSLHGTLNASRALGDEPTLISQLVRIACRAVFLRDLERILAQAQISEKDLADLQKILAEEAEAPLLYYGVRGERAGIDGLMEAIQNGDTKMSMLRGLTGPTTMGGGFSMEDLRLLILFGAVKGQRAALLRFMNRAVEAAQRPVEEQAAALKALEASIPNQPLAVRLLCPAIVKVGTAYHRSTAEMRSAVVALAAERYRMANGHWPESLDHLVPKCLDRVPADPFTGKLLLKNRFNQGIVIYSVGVDLADDGGKINPRTPQANGVDIGFRLWDVKQRRQPAVPFPLPPVPQNVDESENPPAPEKK